MLHLESGSRGCAFIEVHADNTLTCRRAWVEAAILTINVLLACFELFVCSSGLFAVALFAGQL